MEQFLLWAISPLFHYIFNIFLTSGVQLHIHLWNVLGRFFFSIRQIWYAEVRIYRSISASPLDYEITSVGCTLVIWFYTVSQAGIFVCILRIYNMAVCSSRCPKTFGRTYILQMPSPLTSRDCLGSNNDFRNMRKNWRRYKEKHEWNAYGMSSLKGTIVSHWTTLRKEAEIKVCCQGQADIHKPPVSTSLTKHLF